MKITWGRIKGFLLFIFGAVLSGLIVHKVSQISIVPGKKGAWKKVPGRDDQVVAKDPGGKWTVVDLPQGVKADDVDNVAVLGKHEHAIVEVKHEKTDRRSGTAGGTTGNGMGIRDIHTADG